MNHETLHAALEAARAELDNQKAVVADENWADKFSNGGVPYGQMKRADFELSSLKGKTTKKFGHVIIERLDSGLYELIVYCL